MVTFADLMALLLTQKMTYPMFALAVTIEGSRIKIPYPFIPGSL